MNQNKENINLLISRYAGNRLPHEDLKKLQESVNKLSDKELGDVLYAEWERSLAEETIAKRKKYSIGIWSSAAAVAAIFILVFFLTDRGGWESDAKLEQIAVSLKDLSNNTEEIQLIMNNQKTVEVKRGSTVEYQKDGTVSINEIKVGNEQANETEDIKYNRLLVPKGKYTNVILSDGTKMCVNAGTKVVYPATFSDKRREIYVDGEVFLDVAHNKQAPFIVNTAEFNIQVLGTVFNVNAYSDSPELKEVVLAQGKVNITSTTGEKLTLAPNDKATVWVDGNLTKSIVNAEEYMLWTKGILSLKNEELHTVLVRLSRYYGVDIKCSDEIATVNIVGKVDLECSIDEVLRRISITGGFSVTKLEDGYVLAHQKVN
ncbi:FecR family protein [uncultured Bacteroides sp.]|uniref:FecR family protein n=1 Tax=uncultured Bacteroides sp. TaxID=162156 RepID=UPI0025DDC3CF|nr:FecR domain-containing protein [uncultured Bacteroides sp.]